MAVVPVLLLPLRVLLVLLCTLLGLIVQLALFWWVEPTLTRQIIRVWSHTMLACLGVGLHIHKSPDKKDHVTALVVSNHISWMDILALQAVIPVVFVAKSEIKSWPVLGWMVALAGTCFIDRSRRTALRTVHNTLTDHLQAGQSVCIFPEGTTTDGKRVLPFHAGLLQAAIQADVPIRPVCLRYSHSTAAYIDEMTLLGSLTNILLTRNLSVTVQTLPCIDQLGISRQALGLIAHTAIATASQSRASAN